MLKLLGAMLVIGSCFAFAVKTVQKRRESLKALKELHRLLTELAQQIAFSLEPLPSLLNRLEKDEAAPAPEFLQRIKTFLTKDEKKPLSEIWQMALEGYAKEKRLPEKGVKLMKLLGTSLGQMDVETELNRLNCSADALKQLLEDMEKEQAKTEKTTETIGVLLGISIVIFLI